VIPKRFTLAPAKTWQAASPRLGVPTKDAGVRIELAYARANPSIVYASVQINGGEVWRSEDGGRQYHPINTGENYLTQGWYANSIWADDPTDPNIILVGGTNVWRSTNGGRCLEEISDWRATPASPHADCHAIVSHPRYDGTTNRTIFFGNDGGVYVAPDINKAFGVAGWSSFNQNYAVTQFWHGAGNVSSGVVIGGTQDNGTLIYGNKCSTRRWIMNYMGDGGWCAADQEDPKRFYGEYTYLTLYRANESSWSSDIYQGIDDAGSDKTANFVAPFVLNPRMPTQMFAGGARLWRTDNVRDDHPTWEPVSDIRKSSDGSLILISAIAVDPRDPRIVWIGYNDGAVCMTNDAAKDVSNNRPLPQWIDVTDRNAAWPDGICASLTIDDRGPNSQVVYATFGGYGDANLRRYDGNARQWETLAIPVAGSLKLAAPIYTIAVHPELPLVIYAGTEVGIFTSGDGGHSWTSTGDGPGICSVQHLFWMDHTLVAATHGRGLFQLNVSKPPG
jgi:hypothetical protein